MPLSKSGSSAAVRKNTQKLIKEGYPHNQAYAIAKTNQRKVRASHRKRGKNARGRR